jgi:hypothetical protein
MTTAASGAGERTDCQGILAAYLVLRETPNGQ